MEIETEDPDSERSLQTKSESVKEKHGEGSVKYKEKNATEIPCHSQDSTGLPRRSERPHMPSEKMLAYQKDECCKKEKRIDTLYEQWKVAARKARHDLKSDISDKQLAEIADSLEDKKNCIMKIFSEIREHSTTATDLRRKIDACEAVTNDLVKIVLERLAIVDGDFDAEQERRLTSQTSVSSSSRSNCTNKRADAVAELAAKEAEYKMMQAERQQKEKMRTLEEQLRQELETQRFELERLQVEKDIEIARARVKSYDEEIKQETKSQSMHSEHESQKRKIISATERQCSVIQSTTLSEVSQLAQAVQDSIAINRLPIPEPSVFNGDPIQFVDWKASFMSLIDRKGISAADKLYYLKKYVSGSAHRFLEGTFYRSDEEAYNDAWNKLNQRYGQPFIIQRAYREKLSKWHKIQSKDAEGLRTFSDFLYACLQAIPHVKGLEILNDCEENQKLVQKLPDWAAARWNRQVTTALMDGHFAKECRRRHTCDVCKLRHPTSLHDYNYEYNGYRKQPTVNNESEITDATSLNVTREGHSVITSMIVPVWVSSVKNPSNEQLVYALLDTQSDTTFIDEGVSKVLQVDAHPIKLKLTTLMGDSMIINSKRITDLQVRGYNSSVHINLPPLYTKECIPVNRDHIPTRETAKNWSHLKVISKDMSPLLGCEVGLLIGYNCPRVLAPREVILGKEEEPYAILTDLGWSIVGSSTSSIHESTAIGLCHRIATKEIPALTPVDAIHVLESDFKDVTVGDKTISQDDIVFLDKLKEGIKRNAQGHYEMPLPFKQRPYLPDNRELAKVRFNHLNKKFCKNEKYKADYIAYMNDIIERAPYVLNGKRILQEMCRKGTSWDDPLSLALSPWWEKWQNDFVNLEKVDIPRCYVPANFGKIVKTEIHNFSDASTCGYGQCSYLRMISEKDEIHCTFLLGKARVTPVKITTIPRLELTAAVVSVKMSNMLREELDLTNVDEFFWTDSKVVLGKLRKSAEGQRMSDLPVERVESSPPFVYCGMDCFGPFMTKEGRKQHKSLRCFIAVRGTVRQIRCDQVMLVVYGSVKSKL
ncbi:hypothetical protein F2P79_024407 [Pimephales promelas]|nr:hypothetical protein F2P79_024407 [Pimephales promelas]